VCVPISDDEEPLDGGDVQDKREDAFAVDSLLLWRQCLRSPCNVVDAADRERDDVRLRYGYDDGDDDDGGGGGAFMAVGPWPRRRRRGLCVTAEDDDGSSATTAVWPPAVRHCLPNGDRRLAPRETRRRRRRGDACGRLRVTVDSARLRRGTRVSAVCHSLRRLLARDWVRDEAAETTGGGGEAEGRGKHRVYVMCELAADQRDDDDRVGRRRRRRRVAIQVSLVRTQTRVLSYTGSLSLRASHVWSCGGVCVRQRYYCSSGTSLVR